MTDIKPPLIVFVGPTGVGKTDISIHLAERLDGEIVSADSRQFYRGMDIGTAKPTAAERARVPHHLIDVADPSDTWSLSLFQKAAELDFLVAHNGNLISPRTAIGQYFLSKKFNNPLIRIDTRLRIHGGLG